MRCICLVVLLIAGLAGAEPITRPPAIPLIAHDPFLSVWSTSDHLYDDWPRHWTTRIQAMCGIVRVDGKAMRFMGAAAKPSETVVQKEVTYSATRTHYVFQCGPIDLQVGFVNPLLADDLDILSLPASYITFSASANDGQPHEVQIYFDATGEWAVNKPEEVVTWKRLQVDGLDAMSLGTVEQNVLGSKGDDHRINWGHLLLATESGKKAKTVIGLADTVRGAFADTGALPAQDEPATPRRVDDGWPVLAAAFDLGKVSAPVCNFNLILAYDDEYSIQYLGTNLRGWWRRDPGMTTEKLLSLANAQREDLLRRCAAQDKVIHDEAAAAGGEDYAQLCALAYSQSIAANKVVAGPQGQLFMFPKENFSNGCIGTVDIIYPQAPLYLLYSLPLARASVLPLLEYAETPRWKFPFAPHDLGQYPLANGQVYGGGEDNEKNQMPVEESGNMILVIAAIAQREGNADLAKDHWDVITKWAGYLKEKGLDPENQLCTDDFAGHLAHNVNLSAKAILALRAYGMLCEQTGHADDAKTYNALAADYAKRWVDMAKDGDHYKLAFDKPGTWSQKYNLVWDKLLGFGLFPSEVIDTEIAYYKKVAAPYGLALDNRKPYTKLDWLVWTATLAPRQEDFLALMAPITKFLNETPTRVPMTDWYATEAPKKVGFQARSVVGGVFIKTLSTRMPK